MACCYARGSQLIAGDYVDPDLNYSRNSRNSRNQKKTPADGRGICGNDANHV
jgi:hypothetical protein